RAAADRTARTAASPAFETPGRIISRNNSGHHSLEDEMTRNGFKLTVTCAAALLLGAASTLSAQTSDEHIQKLIRAAAARAGVPSAAVGTAARANQASTPAGQDDSRPTVSLSVDDAIKLALDRNLDIAVQRLNPQTFDFSIANLRAVYRP